MRSVHPSLQVGVNLQVVGHKKKVLKQVGGFKRELAQWKSISMMRINTTRKSNAQ